MNEPPPLVIPKGTIIPGTVVTRTSYPKESSWKARPDASAADLVDREARGYQGPTRSHLR